jgi:hypothetical protein
VRPAIRPDREQTECQGAAQRREETGVINDGAAKGDQYAGDCEATAQTANQDKRRPIVGIGVRVVGP